MQTRKSLECNTFVDALGSPGTVILTLGSSAQTESAASIMRYLIDVVSRMYPEAAAKPGRPPVPDSNVTIKSWGWRSKFLRLATIGQPLRLVLLDVGEGCRFVVGFQCLFVLVIPNDCWVRWVSGGTDVTCTVILLSYYVCVFLRPQIGCPSGAVARLVAKGGLPPGIVLSVSTTAGNTGI